MSAPSNHNSEVSLFKGGNEVQIMPMEGGGPSISDILSSTQEVSQTFSSLPAQARPSIISAGTAAAQAVLNRTGDTKLAAAAGLYASFTQAASQQNQIIIPQLMDKLPDSDKKILLSVREGKEKDYASKAANDVFTASQQKGESYEVSSQLALNASLASVKAYRLQNPFTDKTISLDIGNKEAEAILNTSDPTEQDIGNKAYKMEYDSAVANGASETDAKKQAIISQVKAIKESRVVPVTFTTTGLTRTDSRRAQNKKKPALNTKLASKIKDLEQIPLYIEYNAIEHSLNDVYRGIMTKSMAEATVGKTFDASLKLRINNYQTAQLELWGATPTLARHQSITSLKANEVLTSYTRMAYVLPVDTINCIVIPPIYGNLTQFVCALQTLDNMGVLTLESDGSMSIKSGTVVVCSAPFYSSKPTEEQIKANFILLMFFLDLKRVNSKQFFVLSESTSEEYSVGAVFHSVRNTALKEPYINMLEPSYILYPYRRGALEGLLVSSSTSGEPANLPTDSKGNSPLDQIYKNKLYGTATTQIYKPNLEREGANKYFVVRGGENAMKIPNMKISQCGLANYMLPDMIDSLHPSKKIEISYIETGRPLQKVGVIVSFRLQPSSNVYEPLCYAEKTTIKEFGNTFIGSPDAVVSPTKVKIVPYEMGGITYQIRHSNTRDIVFSDWTRGIYTDNEADLLNRLQLKPSIMDKIFPQDFDEFGVATGIPWKDWVARFLTNITLNKSLMTHREMMISRNFLERVYSYFSKRALQTEIEESDSSDDETIQKQHGLVEPDEVSLLEKETFPDIKRKWGSLDVYEDTERSQWIASIILVHKESFRKLYRTVNVPTQQYTFEQAGPELMKKVDLLKRKFSQWVFIY
jgi:hypothetical protein